MDATARAGKLPHSLTPLIGREREVAVAARLLHDGQRLLTLTGPAGVGKTRLSLAIASTTTDLFPDGSLFVSLAPILDPDLVPPVVAAAFDVPDPGAAHVVAALTAGLRACREHGVTDHAADSLNRLGDLARIDGDLKRAEALYSESLALWRSVHGMPGTASALHKLGQTARRRGETTTALRLVLESLELQREIGNKQGLVECLSRWQVWHSTGRARSEPLNCSARPAWRLKSSTHRWRPRTLSTSPAIKHGAKPVFHRQCGPRPTGAGAHSRWGRR